MSTGTAKAGNEGRGEVLEQELLDVVRVTNGWPEDQRGQFFAGIHETWSSVSSEMPGLNDASDEYLRRLGCELQKEARQVAQNHVARGSGMYLVGAYLEATCLPGEHAERVVVLTKPILHQVGLLMADAYKNLLRPG